MVDIICHCILKIVKLKWMIANIDQWRWNANCVSWQNTKLKCNNLLLPNLF